MKQVRDIRGKKHGLVLLLITSRDPNGRPKSALVMYEEDVVHLKGGEEFITAWVPTETIERRS